ncbi:MAG TPA: hypothetical protein VGG18_07230 [Granulicella sp.]|jgi:hypothetical protein
MNKQIKATAISFLLFATGAAAQTTVTGTGTINTVPLFTGSSTLSNSAITQSSGNINIGNPSAHAQLTIYGPEAIGEDTNGTAAIDAYNGDAFFGDNSPTNGIAVNGSGFVGIGTATPGSPLEVKGNIAITRGSTGALVFADGTSLSSAAALQSVSSGSLSSLGTVTTGVWNATPLTSAYLPSDVDYIDKAQTISGQKSFMSNVGIGTATPVGNLNVTTSSGTTTSSIALGANAAPSYGQYSLTRADQANGIGVTNFFDGYTESTVNWQHGTSTGAATTMMSLTGNGTNPATLSLNGSMSIVSTGSGAPFTLHGPPLGSTAGNTLPLLAIQNLDGTSNVNYLNVLGIRYANGSDWTTATTRIQQTTDVTPQGYMDFNPVNGKFGLAFGSGASEFMRIASGGNIGIGTTTPGARLEVNGSIRLTQGSGSSIVFPDGSSLSSAAGLVTSSSGSITSLGTVTTGVWKATPLTAAYLPSNVDYIDQAQTITGQKSFMGNVGIGTTSPPLAPLDVAGTQTIQNPTGGHYLINYGLGGSAEDPNTGDIILLVPASGGSPVAGSQFAGIIQSNRGSTGSWNLNSQWYVSVQSAYTNNTGSITPLSGQQEYSTIPTLVTCVYNGQTYIGFRTPSGNSSSQWSLNGNWSNGQNNQTPILVTGSAVSNIVPLISFESLGSQISMTGIGSSGSIGIGTTSPGARLEVNGSIKLTSASGASITFPDGTVQATAWNGTLAGGDYAESIDVLGDRAAYEPGDVIVIDDSETGKFHKSDKAYSKLVAGVFSTKPGLVGRRTTADRPDKEAEVPMAMMGIVPTKVSAENGPIERGDLLVSSSTPGYAMKGTDRDRLIGTVIGKALAPLKSDSGVIEVLVSLQ